MYCQHIKFHCIINTVKILFIYQAKPSDYRIHHLKNSISKNKEIKEPVTEVILNCCPSKLHVLFKTLLLFLRLPLHFRHFLWARYKLKLQVVLSCLLPILAPSFASIDFGSTAQSQHSPLSLLAIRAVSQGLLSLRFPVDQTHEAIVSASSQEILI